SRHGAVQADRLDAVAAHLRAERVPDLPLAVFHEPGLAGRRARDKSLLGLLELVAPDWVVEKIREVREEIEARAYQVKIGGAVHAAFGLPPLGRQTVSLRAAAVRGVDGAEQPDETGIDGALGYLVGRVPRGAVGHGRHVEPVGLRALGIAQHAVYFV